MSNNFKNVDYSTRARPGKMGKLMREWGPADYELKRHYQDNGMSYEDAIWKVNRLNWEWMRCGWSAYRLERDGFPGCMEEARKLREFFGEEKRPACVLGDCTCTPRDNPCSYCREVARERAASEPEELEYTTEDWVNNFMSKVNRKVVEEMRGR